MHWNLADILDLEYFLRMDADQDATRLSKRDRTIFLTAYKDQEALHLHTPEDKQQALFTWLGHRKDQAREKSQILFPGQLITGTLGTVALCLAFFGLCAGASMALALLTYTGKAPINIFNYLLVLILPQILLLLVLVVVFGLRQVTRFPASPSPMLGLLGRATSGLARRFASRVLTTLSSADRTAFLATLGSAGSWKQTYGRLFFWPLFSLAQVVGVMFNLGALGATLIRVMGSDLAFGWQSTLRISGQAVHDFVAAIALPWSWFVPQGIAYPSLEQIAGSKMILKEGMYHLATPDLVSWWPFLCLALICYGLLPRVLLLGLSRYAGNRVVREHPFSSPDIDRLLFRMTTPLVETTPRDFKQTTTQQIAAPSLQPAPVVPLPRDSKQEVLTVLVPEELADQCPFEQLYQAILQGTGISPSSHVLLDPYEQDTLLTRLRNMTWHENRARVVILQEAWQPPIRELLDFVTTLSALFDHPAMITIALIGKPASETILTPPDDVNAKVWQDLVARLANPTIEVIKLRTAHAS
ncbi:DUF2868 domain-containing protein [Desulfoplanes formicivorans]|uniref:DUF2868 domain-containing protein n=1 Tax=Desulfoplanes formicivorans TaxID=1592317 RepID=A0A194AG21_9BACT|nr:DUF2868 domain-containing protein [Desulfoplanes formicivorans]GAU07719.1 hypothetical protein DPF_0416 [Desulfoplanes formicivorans]